MNINRELKKMRKNAEIVEHGIEKTRSYIKEDPHSKVDWEKILKAQCNLLDAIHEYICDLVIEKENRPFWKKLFRK